jgi:hypothetical protein
MLEATAKKQRIEFSNFRGREAPQSVMKAADFVSNTRAVSRCRKRNDENQGQQRADAAACSSFWCGRSPRGAADRLIREVY